jgi:hypothetical protein
MLRNLGFPGLFAFSVDSIAPREPSLRVSTGVRLMGRYTQRAPGSGARMQADLLDGVVWAVAQRIADPQRVAIMGASYGGYATLVASRRQVRLRRGHGRHLEPGDVAQHAAAVLGAVDPGVQGPHRRPDHAGGACVSSAALAADPRRAHKAAALDRWLCNATGFCNAFDRAAMSPFGFDSRFPSQVIVNPLKEPRTK